MTFSNKPQTDQSSNMIDVYNEYKELADKYKALKQEIDDELKACVVQTIILIWMKNFQPRPDTSIGRDRKRQCAD